MPTVLIADDEADHRELLTLSLHRLGHDVVAVDDAPAAERALEAGGIDAVLLDVRMPGMCGIELCRRLRRDPATAHLPIMLLSADVYGDRIQAGIAAGADDYLTKPYPRSELETRLDAVLRRRTRSVTATASAATAALLAARAALPRPVAAPAFTERPLRRTA
ncbi:response regulator [Actinoplanes sp. NPDC051346]|uniref:response regulator transcription factor n=1 Tax=Actinoplanes sp. NPDC051346 TaxID=3155048 RepID=UPI0034171F3E